MLQSSTLGPEKVQGIAELTARPELKPVCTTSHLGSEESQEHLDGSRKEEGRGTGMLDNEKLKLGSCYSCRGGRTLLLFTFLSWVRLDLGKGSLHFIKLEEARNLTICDVRPEVS